MVSGETCGRSSGAVGEGMRAYGLQLKETLANHRNDLAFAPALATNASESISTVSSSVSLSSCASFVIFESIVSSLGCDVRKASTSSSVAKFLPTSGGWWGRARVGLRARYRSLGRPGPPAIADGRSKAHDHVTIRCYKRL